MPRKFSGAEPPYNIRADMVYAQGQVLTQNQQMMSPLPGPPVLGPALASKRPWVVDCVMASRVLAVLVSVA